MNQRFRIDLIDNGTAHIYLNPNMPERIVKGELNKKFGNDWIQTNYHSNIITNTLNHNNMNIMKKGGTTSNSLTKSVVKYSSKAVKSAGKSIWKGTRKAGHFLYEAGEESAPAIYDASAKGLKKVAQVTTETFNDLFNYGATRLEQYQKYRLLETKQAKDEYNRLMKKYKLGTLKDKKGSLVTTLKKAIDVSIQSASNIDEQMSRGIEKGRRGMVVFDKFDIPHVRQYNIALYLKSSPDMWDEASENESANTAFKNLERVVKRGYWLDSEEWMYKKWKLYIRDKADANRKTNRGKLENIKWFAYEKGGITYYPFMKKKAYEIGEQVVVNLDSPSETLGIVKKKVKVERGIINYQVETADGTTGEYGASEMRPTKLEEGGDIITGGLSDNMPDTAFDQEALEKGMKVESEHTDNPQIAKEITKDHLTENPKYYDYLEIMEGNMDADAKTPLTNISSTETIREVYPTSEEAQETLNMIPEGEDHYLFSKDLTTWDETDLANYYALLQKFVKSQYQTMYDEANSAEDKEKCFAFIQKTKGQFIPEPMIQKILEGAEGFDEVIVILGETGYLDLDGENPNKFAMGGVLVEELSMDNPTKIKDYAMTTEIDGGSFIIYFSIPFSRKFGEEYYRPSYYDITMVVNREGVNVTNTAMKYYGKEIKTAVNDFMLSKAEWDTEKKEFTYKEGGETDRYTFEEKKQIGATIIEQIGRDTRMFVGAHDYMVGEESGNPFLMFKASGAKFSEEDKLRIFVILDVAHDTYIVKGVVIKNREAIEVRRYEGIYDTELAETIERITEGKMEHGGELKDGELVRLKINHNVTQIVSINSDRTPKKWAEEWERIPKSSDDSMAKGGGVEKKYYVIDDNNNGFWQDELSDREREVMIYNPKTDVWHTKRNYSDYYFANRTTNPRLQKTSSGSMATGGGVGEENIYYGVVDANNNLVFESKDERTAKQVSWSHEGSIVKKYSKKNSNSGSMGTGGEIRPDEWLYHVMWNFKNEKPVKIHEFKTYNKEEAEKKYEEVIAMPDIELAYLDKDMFNQYRHLKDHRSLRIFPKFAKGGAIKNYKVTYDAYDMQSGKLTESKGKVEVEATSDNDARNIALQTLQEGSRDEEFIIHGAELFAKGGGIKDYEPRVLQDTNGMYVVEVWNNQWQAYSRHRFSKDAWEIKEMIEKGSPEHAIENKIVEQSKTGSSEKVSPYWFKLAKGGLTEGKSHAEGGIPMKVASTGQMVELEGGEGVINKKNMADENKYVITKPLTPKEIVSCANEIGGNGVNFRGDDTPCPIEKVGDDGRGDGLTMPMIFSGSR